MSIVELLIVVVVLSILLTVLLAAFKPSTQLAKARDAKRKGDLQKLKNPLEDYYNDHKCYPLEGLMLCDPGTGLQPYWSKVPCDPETNDSYLYISPDCNTYRIYTTLENMADVDIAEVGCSFGCGPAAPYEYNYGISSSNVDLEANPEGEKTCDGQWWGCGPNGCNTVSATYPGEKFCNDSNCGPGCP